MNKEPVLDAEEVKIMEQKEASVTVPRVREAYLSEPSERRECWLSKIPSLSYKNARAISDLLDHAVKDNHMHRRNCSSNEQQNLLEQLEFLYHDCHAQRRRNSHNFHSVQIATTTYHHNLRPSLSKPTTFATQQ